VQIAGRSAEALEGYNKLIKAKPADESSMAVASSNLIALRGARDLFDALKKFDKLFEKKTAGQRVQFTDKLEQRLSARQKEAISVNRFLVLLHSNKLDQVRDKLLTAPFLDTFASSTQFSF
jgi:signal recognition particle subunit SRP72